MASMLRAVGVPEFLAAVGLAVALAAVAWPAGRIRKRLGFSPWLGLLAVVPAANVLMLWFLALARWPRAESAQGGGQLR